MNRIITFYFIALAVSLALTPLCRLIALRFGFVAKPKEDRWHKRPTALFGGVAIALTTLGLGLAVAQDLQLWQILGCGLAIAAFGLADDVLSLKPSTKLIVQITLASALLFFGFRLSWTGSLIGDSMLTVFWIVGITNGLNLLDNMDGLCAGTTLIAGLFLLLGMFHQTGATPAAVYLATLLGATTGFLVYNFHPASIFMGDTGSLFLGLNLAALTLVAGQSGTPTSGLASVSVVAGPVLLLLIPIFDTTLVTVMRLLSGRRPSQGGRDHSSHRLVAIGLPEPTAVAVLWALAVFGGGIALSLQLKNQGWTWILAALFFIAMAIFAVYLARIRVYEDADLAKAPAITPLLGDFLFKRRVAEVLLDLFLIPVAYYSAYHLRFGDAKDFFLNYPWFVRSLPIVLACQLFALFVVGGYRGTWRYFGMMDAVVFAKGVLLGTVSAIMVLVFLYNFDGFSRSVFVIDAGLLLLLLAGTRASFRLVGEFTNRRLAAGQRCVIYGTSGASVATIREAFAERPPNIVGFVEDDPQQANARVAGISVLGDFFHLLKMIEAGEVTCVVVNTRVADVDRLQKLDDTCRAHDVELVKIQLNLRPFHVASG
jgi:UDP-GlcNAc:undecaprenyl-phosphate GlcNAc-1-phosphate transferase